MNELVGQTGRRKWKRRVTACTSHQRATRIHCVPLSVIVDIELLMYRIPVVLL